MRKAIVPTLIAGALAAMGVAAQAQTLVYPATVATGPVTTYVVPAGNIYYTVPVPVGEVHTKPHAYDYTRASVTSNVPTRAGEASTFTNGVPNVSTNNTPSYSVSQVYVSPYGTTYILPY